MRSSHPWGFLLCLLFLSSTIHAYGSEPSAQTNTTAAVTFSKLPLTFEPNVGQGPGTAEYLTRSGSMQAGVSGTGLQIRLRSGQRPVDLAMTLAGAKEHAAASPSEKTGGEANYLLGADPTKWKTHIPLYGRVRYKDVYPGIDLESRCAPVCGGYAVSPAAPRGVSVSYSQGVCWAAEEQARPAASLRRIMREVRWAPTRSP